MKISKPSIYILLLIIGIISSCNEELDKFPLDRPSDTGFISNEKELILGINAAYRGVLFENRNVAYPIYFDFMSDVGFVRSDANNGLKDIAVGGASAGTLAFEEVWKFLYSNIASCNLLLEKMPNAQDAVSPELYSRIQGEAIFLRSFYYYWLIELYGDVPYLDEVTELGDSNVSRTSKADIVDYLIVDLENAAQVLPINYSSGDYGRATKGAALTLKARIELFNGKFSMAAIDAQKVIDLGSYDLFPNYHDLFQYAGEESSEVIFNLPVDAALNVGSTIERFSTRNARGFAELVPSQFLVDSYLCTDGKSIEESPFYDLANPFENRDPRLDATIIRDGGVFNGIVYSTHPDSTLTSDISDPNLIKRIANQDSTNPFASFTGYNFRKYLAAEDVATRQSSLDFIFMRYAEVLLIYAEAKIENNDIDQSVLMALNEIRARAYGVEADATDLYPEIVATSQTELREVVRQERLVELAGEGFRTFDIRRWRTAENVIPGTLLGRPKGGFETIEQVPTFDINGHPQYVNESLYRNVEVRTFNPNRDYLWAIPQREIDINPALTQNPNY